MSANALEREKKMTYKELKKLPKGTILNLQMNIPGWSAQCEFDGLWENGRVDVEYNGKIYEDIYNTRKRKTHFATVILNGEKIMVSLRRLWKGEKE